MEIEEYNDIPSEVRGMAIALCKLGYSIRSAAE